MKKFLLLIMLFSIGSFSFSQERIIIPKYVRDISKRVEFIYATDEVVNVEVNLNPCVSSSKQVTGEDEVGTTYYDLQSNRMLSNRIHVFQDASIGTVWTRGVDSVPYFEDRGTAYNYFDWNNSWLDSPVSRVEDERTGWPSYAPFGENGEIIVAHLDSGLKISTRENKGEEGWSYQTLSGPTSLKWPRMITSGEDNNIIHILANSYDPYGGQPRALFYYRSSDAGATWDTEAEVLEGTGSDYYTEIEADAYVWAEENGGAIAFLVGGAWMDLFMMKSTDNGDSWEKTVIWEHPYPFFDWETTITDTFYCVDNSASIVLDNNGVAHVTFGINRAVYSEVGTWAYLYFPFVDGIAYWNEEMEAFSNNLNALSPYNDPGSELVEDYNLIGWTQDLNSNGEIDFINWNLYEFQSYRQLGVSTMPGIGFSGSCGLTVAFSSTTEGFDNGFCNFKHIWVRSKNIDGSWNGFEDFTISPAHMFDECIYPVLPQHSNETGFLVYMADLAPGLAVDEDQVYDNNRIIVVSFDCIGGIDYDNITEFTVSQNTPNPAVSTTSISVDAKKVGNIHFSVCNILGQVVYKENIKSGTGDNTINLVVSHLEPGVYFYTVDMGVGAITKKMIVK